MMENISKDHEGLLSGFFYQFPDNINQYILNQKFHFILLSIVLMVLCFVVCNSGDDLNVLKTKLIFYPRKLVDYFNILNSLFFIKFLFTHSKDDLYNIKKNHLYVSSYLSFLLVIIFIIVSIEKNESSAFNPILAIFQLGFIIILFGGDLCVFFLSSVLPISILKFIPGDIVTRILLFLESICFMFIYRYVLLRLS